MSMVGLAGMLPCQGRRQRDFGGRLLPQRGCPQGERELESSGSGAAGPLTSGIPLQPPGPPHAGAASSLERKSTEILLTSGAGRP